MIIIVRFLLSFSLVSLSKALVVLVIYALIVLEIKEKYKTLQAANWQMDEFSLYMLLWR